MSSMTLPKRNTNNSKNAAKDEKENESQVYGNDKIIIS